MSVEWEDPRLPVVERVQRRILDAAGHTDVSVEQSEARLVETLTAADLGRKVRVRDYRNRPHIGVLEGIEIYAMPTRTILHLVDAWGDIYVHPDFPVEVVA